MTTRPELATDANWLAGVVALGLFVVLAAVFLTAGLGSPAGPDAFSGGESITAGIGYAMFDMVELSSFDSEPFLVAFETIDIVLVAALVAAIMLARRDDDGTATARTDGGRGPGSDRGGDD